MTRNSVMLLLVMCGLALWGCEHTTAPPPDQNSNFEAPVEVYDPPPQRSNGSGSR